MVSCFEILNNMGHSPVHTHMIEFLKNTIKDSWDLLVSYHLLGKDTALNMSCSLGSCFPCKGNVYQALWASWNPFCGCIPFIPSIFPLPWLLNKSVLTLGFCFIPSFPVWLVGTGCICWLLLSSQSSALSFSAFYSHLWAYYAPRSLRCSHTLCWLSSSQVFEPQFVKLIWEWCSAASERKCCYSHFQGERGWGLPSLGQVHSLWLGCRLDRLSNDGQHYLLLLCLMFV